MSRVTDIANAEAEEAENEPEPAEGESREPEPESEPTAEPEPAPELAFGPGDQKRVERAIEAQRRKLATIIGQGGVAHDCLLCGSLGFLPELPPNGTRLTVASDDSGTGLIIEPPEVPPELREAPDKQTCPECDGYGLVLSGSKNANHIAEQCTKCNGNGWTMKLRDEGPTPQPAPYTFDNSAAYAGAGNGGGADAWGRPSGHPHWGVHPASIAG